MFIWRDKLEGRGARTDRQAGQRCHSAIEGAGGGAEFSATSAADGEFPFADLKPGNYRVEVIRSGKLWAASAPVGLKERDAAGFVS
jgi:hypothetical protein